MTLSKNSQYDLDGVSLPTSPKQPEKDELGPFPFEMPKADPLPTYENPAEKLPVFDYEAEEMSDVNNLEFGTPTIEVSEDDGLSFTLPLVPGGDYQDDIEAPEADIEVSDDKNEVEVEDNPWSWNTRGFLPWLSKMMNSVPQHSGRDSAGIERALAYLEALDREISKAVRGDLNNEIDITKAELARDQIYNGIDNLSKRLKQIATYKDPRKQKSKKADFSPEMVKEAQKATHVGGIIVTVPLAISTIARTCINSMVSAGKDIDDCFDNLAKRYSLTPREEMETIQLLADMGYAMRRPRGHLRDEEIDTASSENNDWAQNFPG